MSKSEESKLQLVMYTGQTPDITETSMCQVNIGGIEHMFVATGGRWVCKVDVNNPNIKSALGDSSDIETSQANGFSLFAVDKTLPADKIRLLIHHNEDDLLEPHIENSDDREFLKLMAANAKDMLRFRLAAMALDQLDILSEYEQKLSEL